jgi:hypothetical protein
MEPRRPNQFLQEVYRTEYDHAAAADADQTVHLDKLTRRMKVTKVKYINPTGLAEHAANHAKIQILNGATVVAEKNTDSAGAGDNGIPANTFIDLTLSATAADLLFDADDVLTFKIDESGTTTVPAGRVVVEGVYY